MFQKATKIKKKLMMSIAGLSGSGKTYSALAIASQLGSKIAVIDTEQGSSTLYAEYFDFDQADLSQYHPNKYIEMLRAADQADYDVIVIDSLSHAWLEMLALAGNNYNNWSKVRPLERALVNALLSSPAHIIATMRSKSDYVDGVGHNGKSTKVKVGTKAVIFDGAEYEFDIAGEIDLGHVLTISKSRCKPLQDTTWSNPGAELGKQLKTWLDSGAAAIEQSQKPKPPAPADANKEFVARRRQVFKETYTGLGLPREIALEVLGDFAPDGKLPGATVPEDLTDSDFEKCIELLKEEAEIALTKSKSAHDELVAELDANPI